VTPPLPTIYCIPGLGADERIFARLKLERAVVKPLFWLPPENNEPLGHYAGRLADQIDYSVPHYILGISFGGILAAELARLTNPEGVVLISSVKNRAELPWYFRLVGKLRLNKVLPVAPVRGSAPIIRFFNGVNQGGEYDLLKELIRDTDRELLRWSTDKVVHWHAHRPRHRLVHIHGTADRILTIRYVKPDHRIEGGSHFMIVSRADEIGRLIDRWLAEQAEVSG
jgi:pimeloyl-ACP methyl ester carboxylesterase